MDLPTIEMPTEEARRAHEEYRAALRARHTEEDAQLARGYGALAEGFRLIDLERALEEAGTVDVGLRGQTWTLPRLALVRADAQRCWLEVSRERLQFAANPIRGSGSKISEGVTSNFVVVTRTRGLLPRVSTWAHAGAIVPIVPPRLRPARGLGGYHVLWEAEWTMRAPVDPALLRHVGGTLWAVVATWDLTPLEQTVIMGRARTPA